MRCLFSISPSRHLDFTYINKNNDLAHTNTQTFIRYRHFNSFCPRSSPINSDTATLRSIITFSSSPERAFLPSIELLVELGHLGYPRGLIKRIIHDANTKQPSSCFDRLMLCC